jgi:hypothetical protein
MSPRVGRYDAFHHERPASLSSVKRRKKHLRPVSAGFPSISLLFLVAVAIASSVAPFGVSAATSSPLKLSASVSSPLALSARRPDAVTASVAFNNSGAAAVDWFVASSVSWLSFDTANFGSNLAPNAAAAVTMRASAAGLAMGDHPALLVLGVVGADELLLPVTLTVTPPLEVSPATVTESTALGTTATATVTVTNRASSAVAWTGVASASWIAAAPASGATLAGGASVTLTLTLGAGLGTEGARTGSLALAADGLASEVSASVTLTARLVSGESTLYVGGGSWISSMNDNLVFSKLNLASSQVIALDAGLEVSRENQYSAPMVNALVTFGETLFVGGYQFTAVGIAGTRDLAKFDIASSTWSGLGTGSSELAPNLVYALVMDAARNVLYVGGGHGVLKFDIASSMYSALGSGTYGGSVHALAIDAARGVLYAGGPFTSAGGVSGTHGLAQWNIASSTWSALGSSVSSAMALAVDAVRGVLYAGGSFTSMGGISGTNFIAQWNIASSTWSALGSGVSSPVHVLVVDSGRGAVYTSSVAKYDIATSTWSGLGGRTGTSYALALDGQGALYARIFGQGRGVEKYDIVTSTWTLLWDYSNNDKVSALTILAPTCAAGDVPTDASTATCTPCRPGQYVKDYGSNRRECLSCPMNTANAATLSATLAACAACPPGTGTASIASTSCAQCPAGTYADVVGEGCKPCSAGTVSSAVGATSSTTCAPCAAGTVQPLTGKASCDPCALGTSTTAPGGITCAACAANAFTPQPGRDVYSFNRCST